jgi:RNA polymerase sigma factor (TIGR02999 family)
LRRDRPNHTLQATGLVSEFFLRLARMQDLKWDSRTHFLVTASRIMRHLLIDYARHRATQAHGALPPLTLEDRDMPQDDPGFGIVEVNEILGTLAKDDPSKAQLVELKVFGGLTNAEIAAVFNVSEGTVKEHWRQARARLSKAV